MLKHLPNLITLLRVVLVVPLFWLIHDGHFSAALIVAAVAGVSDALDGFLAKHFGWQSWLGGMLDPIADKLLLMTSFIALALAEGVPVWLAMLVVGRDFVIVCGAVAYYTLIGTFNAAPSGLSKLTTVVQIVCVVAQLVRLSHLAIIPVWVNNGFIVVTAALTVASGLHYMISWSYRARHHFRDKCS